jgi:HEAT repeat protein
MIKYLLLFILPILSNTGIIGFPISLNETTGSCFHSLPLKGSEIESFTTKVSVECQDDSLKALLLKGFIVSPGDSFPIQVGAFKNKSYAVIFSDRIKNLANIKVRITTEGGFNKVRITRFPEIVKSKAVDNTSYPGGKKVKGHIKDITETIIDTSIFTFATKPARIAYSAFGIIDDKSFVQNKIIFPEGEGPWLKRIKYLGESFTLVHMLIITILFSIATMITLLIIILLNRRKIEKEEKLHQYLMEEYQSLIVDYLYGSATHKEFRSIASDSYSRQVLIDQMIDVSANLRGDENKKLLGLYKHLGLDKDSLSRAHDYRWHKKIKGFRELAFMNIKDANNTIYKALNSSNEILRMEAQIALVRLSDDNHFEFLSHLKRPFSLWEQITLHDLIIQHNIPVPEFKKWLTSPNDSVVIFALRMIREFKQKDAEEGIKNSLLHNSAEVRFLAVQVAGDLGLSSTLEIMKRMYKNQDYKICLEIVRSMGKIPDTSMLGFLKLVLDKEDDVQLQIEATKSIEMMGEEGVKALVKIMKSEYKNYNIIVRHVLDRRIN